MRAKFGMIEQALPRPTLTGQISSECVHCVGFRWPKTTILGKFLTFWGLLYRPPFTDEGQMWRATADSRYTLTCQISSRSVYSVALCLRKTPIFAVFWTSACNVVASWQQSDKVEHGCTTTNLLLSNGIKIVSVLSFLYSSAFIAKSGAQSLTFKSVTNKQTDKQTKNSTFLAIPAAGEI